MVFAIVAVMFLLLFGISYFVEQKRKREASATAPAVETETPMYIHPSHTFARVASDGTVEIGMDEFAQRAFGDVEFIELPAVGTTLRQGDRLWKAKVGDRSVFQRMPVTGEIMETNQTKKGWILKAKVSDISTELGNLIKSASMVPWLKKARAQFVTNYTGELMPALQDGGELADGFARHLTDDQWKAFCREFFNCESCED